MKKYLIVLLACSFISSANAYCDIYDEACNQRERMIQLMEEQNRQLEEQNWQMQQQQFYERNHSIYEYADPNDQIRAATPLY